MIATAKRPPTATLVPTSAIEQATMALQSLPEKPREQWSMREAVDHMRAGIMAALGKGYSYDEVAVMLSERGVQISPSSLKYYLTRVKRNERSTSRRTSTPTTRRSKKTAEEIPVAVTPVPEEPKVEAPTKKSSTTTATSRGRSTAATKTTPKPAPETTTTKTQRSTRPTSASKAKPEAKKPQTNSKSDSTASKTTTKKTGTTRRKQTA